MAKLATYFSTSGAIKLVRLENKREIVQDSNLYLLPLTSEDIPSVLEIEKQVYDFPWSQQIFKDCLFAGYSNWGLIKDKQLIGYALLSIAVEEAHILNICISPRFQKMGYATKFVQELFNIAREKQAANMFLEVRPTNEAAVRLYGRLGFKEVGRRKGYYPAKEGREDALVLSYHLD